MAVSAEVFLALVEKSHLLTPDQFQAVHQRLGKETDPKAVARALIKDGLLNKWQAVQLLAGRWALTIGRFKCLDQLSADDVQRVYLAEDPQAGRTVVVVTLARQYAQQNPEQAQRFLERARKAVGVEHPYLARVWEAAQDEERCVVMSEQPPGVSLESRLRDQGPLANEEAVRLLNQACEGLAAAHAAGICHGGLSPACLFLESQGDLKIAGWGDHFHAGPNGAAAEAAASCRAPELSEAQSEADARSDIYSLGCILFAMLTGQWPESSGAAARLSEERPDAPPALVACCRRMLAASPEDRYPTIADLQQQLAAGGESASSAGEASVAQTEKETPAARQGAPQARSPRAAEPAAKGGATAGQAAAPPPRPAVSVPRAAAPPPKRKPAAETAATAGSSVAVAAAAAASDSASPVGLDPDFLAAGEDEGELRLAEPEAAQPNLGERAGVVRQPEEPQAAGPESQAEAAESQAEAPESQPLVIPAIKVKGPPPKKKPAAAPAIRADKGQAVPAPAAAAVGGAKAKPAEGAAGKAMPVGKKKPAPAKPAKKQPEPEGGGQARGKGNGASENVVGAVAPAASFQVKSGKRKKGAAGKRASAGMGLPTLSKKAYIIGGAVGGGVLLLAVVGLVVAFSGGGDRQRPTEVAQAGETEVTESAPVTEQPSPSDIAGAAESDPELDPVVTPVASALPPAETTEPATSAPTTPAPPESPSVSPPGESPPVTTPPPTPSPGDPSTPGPKPEPVPAPPEAESPKTQPKENTPAAEKPEAKKPATPAKPPAGKKPFQDLPALIALPAADAADADAPKPVGPIYVAQGDLCIIKLRGSDRAFKGSQSFGIRNGNGGLSERDWDIFLREGQSGPETMIAALAINDQNQLTFRWQPQAKDLPAAAFLTNCALSFSCTTGDSKVALLRQPDQQPGLIVDLEKPAVKQDWKITNAPHPDNIRVQIAGVSGSKFTVEPNPVMSAEKGEAWIKLEDQGGMLSFQVQTSLKRELEVIVIPHVRFSADTKPEKFNLRKIQQYKSQLQQQQAQMAMYLQQIEMVLKNRGAPEGEKRLAEQRKLTFQNDEGKAKEGLAKIEAFEKMLKEVKPEIKLRVFFDADTTEVDLLKIGT